MNDVKTTSFPVQNIFFLPLYSHPSLCYHLSMQLWPLMEEKLVVKSHPFISVTGGGGKTTFLTLFGDYLRRKGMSVLLTTTTKLAYPGVENYGEDYFCTTQSSALASPASKGSLTLYAHDDGAKRKLFYPGEDEIESVRKRYDVVLCEADGSRHLPLKIHTPRDPVILQCTTAVVSFIGVWCAGKMTGDTAFGETGSCVVDKSYLQAYIDSEEGPFKGMRDDTENILLFNGGDEMPPETEKLFLSLVIPPGVEAYIVSERKGVIYHAL